MKISNPSTTTRREASSTNGPATAVIYLRVSTPRQAKKDGEIEGYSLPAQRRDCEEKAQLLPARVVEEFIERGESAKTADRPELRRMLAYIAENRVDYVIVHKINRLARNRYDDAMIGFALHKAGARLVSVVENIDETPAGKLVHGIVSSVSEYESNNLGAEVIKGMSQKARLGGTVSKTDLGYLNVHRTKNGEVVRTVITDRVRGPHMTWAFETCATGDWSLTMLTEELARRGLLTRPTRTRPARPLSRSQLHRLLRSPYYKGVVVYQGEQYKGKHKPLVSEATWQRVQEVLTARNLAGERQRRHPHYLIGSVYCGSCESRMIVDHARSRSGKIYRYFVCAGRHQKRTDCLFSAVQIKLVESEVVIEYGNHRLTPEEREQTETALREALKNACRQALSEAKRLQRQKKQLVAEREKLMQAHYAGAVPVDLLRSEQERIGKQLQYAETRFAEAEISQERIERYLSGCLALLVDVQALYRKLGKPDRKLLNQALFAHLEVTEEDEVEGELASPFDVLTVPPSGDRCLTKKAMVRLAGQLSNPSETLQKALDMHCRWRSSIKYGSSPRLKPKAKLRRTRHNPPADSPTLR